MASDGAISCQAFRQTFSQLQVLLKTAPNYGSGLIVLVVLDENFQTLEPDRERHLYINFRYRIIEL